MMQVTEPFQNFSLTIWRVFCLVKKSQDLKYKLPRIKVFLLNYKDPPFRTSIRMSLKRPHFLENSFRTVSEFRTVSVYDCCHKIKHWHYLIAKIMELDPLAEAL